MNKLNANVFNSIYLYLYIYSIGKRTNKNKEENRKQFIGCSVLCAVEDASKSCVIQLIEIE